MWGGEQKKEKSLLKLGCKKSKLAQLAWLNCPATVKLEQSSLRIHCRCSRCLITQPSSGCRKDIFPMTFDGRYLKWVYLGNRFRDRHTYRSLSGSHLRNKTWKGRSEAGSSRGTSWNEMQLQSWPQPPHGDLWIPWSFTIVLN